MPSLNVSDSLVLRHISGNASRGGWEALFSVMSDTDLFSLYQEITFTMDPIFGGVKWPTTLVFHGHAIPKQYSFAHDGSLTELSARTSDAFLESGWLQGVHFVDVDAAGRANYHQFDSVTGAVERLTLGRLVRHILGYDDTLGVPPGTNPDWVAHCNLVYDAAHNPHGWIDLDSVETTPWATPGNLDGTARAERYIIRETNNLWSAIRSIATNDHFVAYFDKNNTFHYERNPMFQAVLPAVVMIFTETFCAGRPQVAFRDKRQVDQVKYHAVTDDADTIHANYPSSVTHVYGRTINQSRFRCNDADQLEYWATIRYAWENRPYTVRWPAPGLCGLLFELYDRVGITYTGTDENGVDIDWTNRKFWITDIQVTPGGFLGGNTVFTLEAEHGIP